MASTISPGGGEGGGVSKTSPRPGGKGARSLFHVIEGNWPITPELCIKLQLRNFLFKCPRLFGAEWGRAIALSEKITDIRVNE